MTKARSPVSLKATKQTANQAAVHGSLGSLTGRPSPARGQWPSPYLAAGAAMLLACGSEGGSGPMGEPDPMCSSQLTIPNTARSCALLLNDEGPGVSEVLFSAKVVGEWIREAPQTAIALHAALDAPMAAGALTIRGGYVVAEVECFDGEGALVTSDMPVDGETCND